MGPGFRVGLMVQGWVQGSGFRVQGSGIRVQGAGFRVQGSGFRARPMSLVVSVLPVPAGPAGAPPKNMPIACKVKNTKSPLAIVV